ncbi:hypothetical protein [Streptococcus ruminantium]|uniref:hypothetical protein n=1 Tax=Streptococcus ruminantium TaxID=1917441 RepID=UPI0012DF1274|nr:hypothetical protein [Streptococcus ruminantium]
MAITMNELKKLQEKNSIQQNTRNAEKMIDKRIEITVLDDNESYKAFSVVVAIPNSTIWSGRGPLFLRGLVGLSLEVADQILEQLASIYREAGYTVTGPQRIDIGMHETAPGIHITIPNQLEK